MSARGPYAKGVAKRAEILEVALEIIARNGYSGATVKELADAVGLSQNGLLHYFGSKDALFTEILRRRDEVDTAMAMAQYAAPSADDIVESIVSLVRTNAERSGFVQLYSRLSNEASEPAHPSHEYFRRRYDVIHENGVEFMSRLQREGRIAADLDPRRLGIMLFALIDGLQTQWMYDPESVDMAEEVAYFFRLVAPHGAAEAATPSRG